MITIIICAVIGAVGGALFKYEKPYSLCEYVIFIICAVFGLIIGACFGVFIALALPAKTELVKTESYKIEAMQDNTSIKGSFVLGCGTIEGESVYTYYYEDKGFYKLGKVKCEKALICYSDSCLKVEHFETKDKKDAFINYFAINATEHKYIFYIPKGSIKQNFTLDLQ